MYTPKIVRITIWRYEKFTVKANNKEILVCSKSKLQFEFRGILKVGPMTYTI